MRNKNYIKLTLVTLAIMFIFTSTATAQLMGNIFPSTDNGTNQQTGPTEINSNSMDINLKEDTISLYGNVVVNNSETRINADELIVYLEETTDKADKADKAETTDKADKPGKKEAKKLVAIGNVIILKKSISDGKSKGEEKATSGKAEYDIKTGEIVLTDDPILYQGSSYIRGDKITLYRNSDRVKVEGNQSMGQASKMIYNPSPSSN